ncbi:MAG: TonB-dependent receptor [Bryobacteraceae bacterium]|nr:TonB-dependent receptor [Bryobacteraceae bacterium]
MGALTAKRQLTSRCLLLLAAALLCAAPALSQGDRGTITGLVTDSTQAAIPEVEITITHVQTNVQTSTRSGSTGVYNLLRLPVGNYTLVAKKEGFRAYQQTEIPVRVGETLRLDITLEIGQLTEQVTVVGAAPLISSESAEVGLVLTSAQFTELPLTLGGGIRNPSSFIFLQPGVSPGNTWEKHVNGNPAFTDQVYYDGIALSRGDLANDAEVNPSVDAIAEFKLISNNYSAEYSHGLGGVTTFNYKSGTNELHGNGFVFNSVEAYNARNFFQPEKPKYRQNNWGFTVGGPIVLPKVYDGRNKSFFFFSLDTIYVRAPGSPGLSTVPTAGMLQGNFTDWVNAGRGMVYDPATGRRNESGAFVRDPFPGNIVPQARWSNISSKMVAMHPQPTYPGLINNYQAVTGAPESDQRTSGFKIDHLLSDAHRLSGMFNWTDRPAVKCPGGNNTAWSLAGDLECHNVQRVTTRILRLNYDWTVSPTVLNRFSAGLSRFRNPNFSVHFRQGWIEKIGLKGVADDLFPWVDFNHDYMRFGDTIASDNYFTNFTFVDTVSIIRGNHTLKIGGEVQRHRNNFRNFGTTGGNFQFNQLSTGLPGVTNSGNSWASFLLGDVYNASAFFPFLQSGNRNGYYSLWANDDWKVTPRLTLNLGFRWEVQPGFTDPNNRISFMDPTVPNPGAGGLPGAYIFAGDCQGCSGFTSTGNTHWRDFAPRLGFAYRLTDKTVVRGGYGIFFAQIITQGTGVNGLSEGYNVSASFATGDSGLTPAFNWDNGFPQNFPRPPLIDPTLKNTQSANFVDRDRSTLVPYTQQYNFLIEHQVGQSTSFSAGYVANLGRRIHSSINWNQTDPRYLNLGALLQRNILDPQVAAAGFGEPYPGFASQWGTRGTLVQALKRWPQFTSVGQPGSTFGNSSYHSLQISGERRMSRGLMFTLAYTFSKAMANTEGFSSGTGAQDWFNRALDKSITSIDQPHILTFSYIYELPFGRGKRFAQGGVASKIAGGWKITGLHMYSSGTPIAVIMNNPLPIGNPSLRPNVVSSDLRSNISAGEFDPGRGDLWLNPAAFATPASFTFGNAPRYTNARIPTRLTESLGLLKDTQIGERYNLQLRFESSNPFNRVVFGGPVSNFSSGSFGRIGSAAGSRQLTLGAKFNF